MKNPATINRSVVLVVPLKPFFEWENSVFPESPLKEDDLHEHNSYLLSDELIFSDPKVALKKHWKFIFENELFDICTDDSAWPQKLTWNLFNQWFKCYFSSIVIDLETKPLYLESY